MMSLSVKGYHRLILNVKMVKVFFLTEQINGPDIKFHFIFMVIFYL